MLETYVCVFFSLNGIMVLNCSDPLSKIRKIDRCIGLEIEHRQIMSLQRQGKVEFEKVSCTMLRGSLLRFY